MRSRPSSSPSAAGRIRTVADLDRLAGSLVGSAHLLASVDGRVRVQGTVTGIRRVFSADVAGAVAADRADLLAPLKRPRRTAAGAAPAGPAHPLPGRRPAGLAWGRRAAGRPLPGAGRRRRHRSVRWWSPPEPVLPMAEGAPALRDALAAAVAGRRGRHGQLRPRRARLDRGLLAGRRPGGDGRRVHRGEPRPAGRRRRLGRADGRRSRRSRAPRDPGRGDPAGVRRAHGAWPTGSTSRARRPWTAPGGSPSPTGRRRAAPACT